MAPIYDIPSKDSKRAAKILELAGVEYSPRPDLEKYDKQIVETDSNNYIVMPADFVKGKYGQEDISISPARVSDTPEIRKIGKNLGLKLRNTSKDSLGREFVGDINWEQAMKINLLSGKYTLPLDQFADFLNLLNQGRNKDIDVYNKAGKKLGSKYLENIYSDIVGVKNPWRAEWLDADFKFKNGRLYINKNYATDEKGDFVPGSSEILKSGLMQNRTPGIDLESWIKNPTKQGLPRKDVLDGDLYFWAPMKDNNSVAWFDADSVGAGLSCSGGPSYRYPGLGVRVAKKISLARLK